MPSDNRDLITLYVKDVNGIIHTIGKVKCNIATRLSKGIEDKLNHGGCYEMKDRNGAMFTHPKANVTSARKIWNWMKDFDEKKPKEVQHLTLKYTESEKLEVLTNMQMTANEMKVPKCMRGEEIRDGMIRIFEKGPITVGEFDMVTNRLWNGYQLFSVMIDKAVEFQRKKANPNFAAIEKYCKRPNLANQIFLAQDRVTEKKLAEKAQKAKAAEKQ